MEDGSGDNMYTANNICKMIEVLTANIFVQFVECLFHQTIGIQMGTNYAPSHLFGPSQFLHKNWFKCALVGSACSTLLAELLLNSNENKFLDSMIGSDHRRLTRSFNLCTTWYIDDLIVFNNKFLDYPS